MRHSEGNSSSIQRYFVQISVFGSNEIIVELKIVQCDNSWRQQQPANHGQNETDYFCDISGNCALNRRRQSWWEYLSFLLIMIQFSLLCSVRSHFGSKTFSVAGDLLPWGRADKKCLLSSCVATHHMVKLS